MILNVQTAKVNLYFDKPYFYVGEYIKGSIEIKTNSTIALTGILIEIILTEHWKLDDGSNFNKTMTETKVIVTYNLDLKSLDKYKTKDNKILLPNGITFVPFNFRFSENNNPSFEYPLKGKRAFLRYNFRASLRPLNILGGSGSYYLCLISRPIIQSEKLLTKSINQHIKKWKVFDKGDTILKISIPENNYKYDSECKVSIEIDNTNGKAATKEYKIMLIRKIRFKNKFGEIKCIEDTNIVSERVRAIVAPKKKEVFEYNLQLQEKIPDKKYSYFMETNPYNIEINKINFYMPTINGLLISCNYEIKVSLYFNCFVSYDDRPRLILPIYIVHQLPYDYQLEIQEQIDYENALQKSMFEEANKKQKDKINIRNNYQVEAPNYKENKNSLSIHNININNNQGEEEESLPSLEAIEEAKKNKFNNNIIIENKNDININKINEYDNCPPPLLESAPVPLGFEEPHFNYEKNNAYPIYNPINFNENVNNTKEIININQINDINDNNNQMRKYNILPKESPEDFSLFDTDNNFDNIK